MSGDHPAGWPTGRLLSTAARLVEQRWNEALARYGLNHAGFGVLAHLMGGPLSQHEVAALTKVEDQTISRTLDRLERQGHVRREPDPADRRRRVVHVTTEGRTAFLTIASSGIDLEMVDERVAEHCGVHEFRAALLALLEPGALATGSGTGTGPAAERAEGPAKPSAGSAHRSQGRSA